MPLAISIAAGAGGMRSGRVRSREGPDPVRSPTGGRFFVVSRLRVSWGEDSRYLQGSGGEGRNDELPPPRAARPESDRSRRRVFFIVKSSEG